MDDVVSASPDYYKDIVESGKAHVPAIYCIMPASNPDNLFDIVSCNELIFNHYKRNRQLVIGLASSHKNAVWIVMAIVNEMYNETGKFDIRDYLGCDI